MRSCHLVDTSLILSDRGDAGGKNCSYYALPSFTHKIPENDMVFDAGTAQRLRETLAEMPEVVERRMFGGVAFMICGHMSCGVIDDVLMVRVGPERHSEALLRPHARPMDFTGRPLNGFVYVDPPGFESDEDLALWVDMSLEFVTALPPK